MANFYASKSGAVSERETRHLDLVRRLAGECMTLLENDGALPLKTAGKLAVYGNGVRHTIKGGTGSGDVNTRTVVTVEQGLTAAGCEITSEEWLDEYDRILQEAQEAYQAKLEKMAEELHVPAVMLTFSVAFEEPDAPAITKKDEGDTAIYVLARNSGEGSDRFCKEGDYLLSTRELENIRFLAEHYEKTILVLNVANLVDTTALREIAGINAILLAGQAGNNTGNIVADVLLGKSYPSGKLTDTWAASYEDYPSSRTFSHNNGNIDDEYYTDGIYVGYRYFDTFGVKPNYCFGYGKGYTEFSVSAEEVSLQDGTISVKAKVTNIGKEYPGKEVVQVYYSAPEGTLEKPYQELAAFGKTDLLEPGESETLTLSFPVSSMASYSEKKAAWILEPGTYYLRVGNSSRSTRIAAAITLSGEIITEQVKNLFPLDEPVEEITKAGAVPYTYAEEEQEKAAAKVLVLDPESIQTKTAVYREAPEAFPVYDGKKLTVSDVKNGTATLQDLVSQLTPEEMAAICNGTADGLGGSGFIGSSSAMAPGAAGDTTSTLIEDRDIRNTILSDGPAGLRLSPHFVVDADGNLIASDNPLGGTPMEGTEEIPEGATEYYQYCTAIPVASLLAQSWNLDLIEQCGSIVGAEMEEFHISVWLAPGMNIHRNPLCGRNFEYYSEDPLLAGLAAAADTRGIQSHPGIGTSIKHFAANNQEDNRMYVNEHITERTLREIYLKGFEIAVKTSQPMTIMSSYNLINGIHTANSYDLLTAAARDEWGFAGYVMTDWGTSEDMSALFAAGHKLKYSHSTSEGCILAGNDVQMPGCAANRKAIVDGVASGAIPLGQLQTCTWRVLDVILQSIAYEDCKPYGDQFELETAMTIEKEK